MQKPTIPSLPRETKPLHRRKTSSQQLKKITDITIEEGAGENQIKTTTFA